jgi:ABC-type Zn uptake system ZnuABC Zn-binding protein ZnuA
MKRQQAKVILVEPYFDTKTPDSVAREVGGKVLVLSPSVGGVKEASDYIKLFDYNIGQLTAIFKQVLGR